MRIIKDLIISILIVICMVVSFSVIFYDQISLSKVIPQSEDYLLSEEMKKGIEDSISEEEKEVVTKYYIDAADLKKYEKTKEYNKGKKNPFAAEVISPSNTATNTNTSSDLSENNNKSEHFYEDDGTK